MGWIMEVVGKLIEKHRFINRGFLIGPVCPIYGFGCISMIVLLSRYLKSPVVLFVMAIIICSILEYVTSFLMEKLFHARWWDYSRRKFNINGRICLETMIPFGLLGCLIMYIVNPFFTNILMEMPYNVLSSITAFIFAIFLIDNVISFIIMLGFRDTIKTLEKDGTEEIAKKVRKVLLEKGWLYKRLVNAFPSFKNKAERLKEMQKNIDRQLKNLKRKKRK